jgi:hypothetical protein
LLDNGGFANEYAICDTIIMRALRRRDNALVFAFGKHDGLPMITGLLQDGIYKWHAFSRIIA